MGELLSFGVTARDGGSRARAGVLSTPHGVVETPCFMPVATNGSVKTLSAEDLESIGARMVISNAYHLHIRPGCDIIEGAGGIHRFMGWSGAVATDSGGFQVFSLEDVRIADDGVEFKSLLDGARRFVSPESAMRIQERIGADLAMAFDYCPRRWDDRAEVERSVAVTAAWARRCRAAHAREGQWLFGIVQGGRWPDLRRQASAAIADLDFPGFAFGGLSIGEPFEATIEAVEAMIETLPAERMRYFMGLGGPLQILDMAGRGVDLFDCALPTHIARNGSTLTRRGKFNIKNGRWKGDGGPLDPDCGCFVCRRYNRAYLRHLFNASEIAGLRLNSYHNLYFMERLMADIRAAVAAGRFADFRKSFEAGYNTRSAP